MLRRNASVFLFTIFVSIITIIISLHLKDQTKFSQLPCQNSKASNLLSRNSSRYLWCVNHYGPNNQLKDFIKCCIITILNNYTLVIPPLFPHYGRRKTHHLQWFDQFYDLKQLSLSVNLITLDQFIPQVKSHGKKVMIDCYIRQIELITNRMWYPKNTLISIQNHYKINIDFSRSINLSRQFNLKELSKRSQNCSSIFLHIHYTTFPQFFSSPNIHIKSIFEHLRRTALIQRMASQLIILLPKLVIGRNSPNKTLSKLAVVHMRLGDYTVMNLGLYIKQILYLINSSTLHFTHLHIMCPFLSTMDIKQLNNSLPIAFTTSQHLLNHVHFVLDDYLFDVLEQEIAYQAPIFLASPWTSYSATVMMQKVYQQKGSVYLLSKKVNSPPLLVTKKNVKYFEK